jgi:hypothetical protein
MLEDQLDQAALACAEMSMNATARQTVQERDGLLSEKYFEFVGGHVFLVTRTVREKRDLREKREGSKILPRRVPPFPRVSRFPRLRDTSDALTAIPPVRRGE